MPPKAPADGVSAVAPKRTRKAAAPASKAKATTKPAAKPAATKSAKPKPTPKPAAAAPAPATDATAQRRIGGGWLAVGVGSAALVAALLFATRGKRNDWSK
ncbi:hypothetical protein EUV02_05380 [Polymorphobacter arshaanensis]|uniref:Uncharacterized protein n=1 Tax=Glacieibacterium arshaanense TaxID=2511025 RepID=A0A4Y9ESH7_9SPHN|nr:hypothetical protein [Polymorphobacter arshaanensis]TFU06422.1 hypothetical protein EUV02_05380 [Polymorphobacter arshaanensis]